MQKNVIKYYRYNPPALLLPTVLVNIIVIVLINTEIPKVTYYYVSILNLNLKCIINFLKVISIS